MKIGSIAIALSAEYGEFCPPAISLSGSSCTNANPASDIHEPSVGRSVSSPMPQLRREGIETSGTSRPAYRSWKKSRGIDAIQDALHAAREGLGLLQQADHEERLVREVEEVARVRD